MKKLFVMGLVLVLGAGVAMAVSLNVPFFLDDGDNLSGNTPTVGSAGFIGIKNTTGAPIIVRVDYTSVVDGVPVVEDNTDATFELGANAAISFRPVATDGVEGAGSIVRNMASGKGAGSATIIWTTGNTTDIQGRYVELRADGNIYAYLLPPGV